MATSFSGGESRNTRREPLTMSKQLVNFITCGCESKVDPAARLYIYRYVRRDSPVKQL
jgi:hypothetical protein